MAAAKAAAKAIAQRRALIALSRHLVQDRAGGLLGPALEMIVQALRARGGVAYAGAGDQLDLVSEVGLPRTAKPWLARLSTSEEAWFVAQRVAASKKVEVDADVAASRAGVGIRPALEEAGWEVLCAAPIVLGRKLYGVLVLATRDPSLFDKETTTFLSAVGSLIGLALDREQAVVESRQRRLDAGRAAQLATLGQVSEAVARDLSTPLRSLSVLCDDGRRRLASLREAVRSGETASALASLDELEVLLADARESQVRAENVASRLTALGTETQPERLDLGEVLEEAADMIATDVEGRGAHFELHPPGREAWVEGRREILQLMLVQLLLYAAEQCREGEVKDPRIDVHLHHLHDTEQVTIETAGRGDTVATARVFDRLVSRSAKSGLGLELARQTIRAHEGHIELGRSTSGGLRLAVVLPAAPRGEEELDGSSLPPRASPPGAIPTIVWIDDDAAFVRAMCRNIRDYRALVAGTVAEARELLTTLTAVPELILCDVNLPDGLGTTIHASAAPEHAERFVFITGAVLSDEIARYLKASGRPTLIKPIKTDDVLALIDEDPGAARPSMSPTLKPDAPEPELPDGRSSFPDEDGSEGADAVEDASHRDALHDLDETPRRARRRAPTEPPGGATALREQRRRNASTPPTSPEEA